MIAEKVKCETMDLNKKYPNVNDWDLIVIGSNIRMGKFNKNVRAFLKYHKNELLNKKVAYFICSSSSDSTAEYFHNNLSPDLIANAVIMSNFGGELQDNLKGFDKFVINMVKKANPDKEVKLQEEEITNFINKINLYK